MMHSSDPFKFFFMDLNNQTWTDFNYGEDFMGEKYWTCWWIKVKFQFEEQTYIFIK